MGLIMGSQKIMRSDYGSNISVISSSIFPGSKHILDIVPRDCKKKDNTR